MRTIFWSLLILLVSFVWSCRSDDVKPQDIDPPIADQKIETMVHGLVFDENRNPITYATVRMGTNQTTTNEFGYFQLSDLQPAGRALVYVERPGYFNAYPVFKPNEGSREFLEIQLIERELTVSISATDGGVVSLPDGSEIIFAPGSFVLDNGATYTGEVQVYAHYLDPTDEKLYQYMPGNLTAVNAENEIQALITYGMINVELETPFGESLNIDQDATINLPVPNEIISNAPPEIPLWYYDEDKGLWVEEGQATLSGNIYSGSVSHFTFWNYDVPYNLIQLTGRVDVAGNTPRVKVSFTRIDNGDMASDYTDDRGFFDGLVPEDQILQVEVINNCGTIIHTEEIGPFNSDTDIGTFFINNSGEFSQVKGMLLDCGGEAIEGVILCSTGDVISADAKGVFNSLISTCGISEINMVALDLPTQSFSNDLVFTVEPIMDIGPIQACGNTVVSSIYFELNGGPTLFYPNCTVEKVTEPSPGTAVHYIFSSTFLDGPNVYLDVEYKITNQTGDPTDPVWVVGGNTFVYDGPVSEQGWAFDDGTIIPIFEDDNPGGIIQFEIQGCRVDDVFSSLTYSDSKIILTGIFQ